LAWSASGDRSVNDQLVTMSELVDRNDVGDHQTDELARPGGGPDRPGRGWSFARFCHSRLPTAVTGSVAKETIEIIASPLLSKSLVKKRRGRKNPLARRRGGEKLTGGDPTGELPPPWHKE